LTSLLSFNLGVELGQLMVLAILVPLLELCFRWVVAERMGTIILSALVAHTGWHWMLDRAEVLRRYDFQMPEWNAELAANLLRWSMAVLFLAGAAWLAVSLLRRRADEPKAESRASAEDAR